MICRPSLVIGLFTVSHLIANPAAAHVDVFSDSGINGPPYATIVRNMETLETEHPENAKVFRYGTSRLGKPLVAIRIADDTRPPSDRPVVLISGSTHGNEYINIEDRLPGWFLENKDSSVGLASFLAMGGIIYVVPILNPDGYDRDQRGNAAGVDLNRDFDLIPTGADNFTQPETRDLAAFVETRLTDDNGQLQVSVDYHCCDGSLLYPWSYTRSSLPAAPLARHREIARLMQQHINSRYEHGSTGQVLGYYPLGTSKDYYYAKYGTLAFTFEGSYRTENQNFAKHTAWWDAIFASLAAP